VNIPIFPERRFIDNDGVTLCIERFGEGAKTLLFVHGWISARRMWYDVLERLDPSTYMAHLLDFRGCGLSDRPIDGHNLAGYASDLRRAIEAIDEPLVVVAHSMGGKVAQLVATEQPANLQKLILVAPASARAVKLTERHRELSLEAFGSRKRIERFQRSAMIRDVRRTTIDRIVEDALVTQREAWFGWYDHGRGIDFSERIERIAIPTAVIAADRDPLAPASRLRREVAGAIKGAILVQLKECGHNIPIEAPDEVAGVIHRFA
jgi:pimeloyl-ACP methyl ester carboxylesterase